LTFLTKTPSLAWIDHVVRVGVSFRYTDKVPEGMVNASRNAMNALIAA
jgi:FMN-dependent NADH-azoreductase